VVEGFRLDRGFQVLLTAYPELDRQLDVAELNLRTFDPGAAIWTGSRIVRLADPRRVPLLALSSARAPVGGVGDKARLLRLVWRVLRSDPKALLREPDATTLEALQAEHFSATMIETFFRPLFGGIQLDMSLGTSRRMFDTILRCLVVGESAVPAHGMQAIPDQLSAGLPPGVLMTRSPVVQVAPGLVHTQAGATIAAQAVVVACEGPVAARLLEMPVVGSKPATCVWFAAPSPPTRDKLIVLDGTGHGPAANVAIMSNVAPEYAAAASHRDTAPRDRALIAAACPGVLEPDAEPAVRDQLTSWWGPQVQQWRHLRTDAIAHGQPDQPPPLHPRQPVSLGEGLFVCGDHRDTASIQGALYSGRRCGEAVVAALA